MWKTVHQNISKTYQFHFHFKISRLFFEYPPPSILFPFLLHFFTSRLLSSRRYNLAILHFFPLCLFLSRFFLIYPSAYSALPLPPFSQMLAPSLLSIFLRQPFSIGVPTLSKRWGRGRLLLTREGGFCTSSSLERKWNTLKWRGGSTLERFCFAIEYLRPRFIGCRFS